MKKIINLIVALTAAVLLCGGVAGCAPQKAGTFYTVKEAYEAGFLTRDDIMTIAYYHNGGRVYNEESMGANFTPVAKTPQELSKETSLQIRNTAAYDYRKEFPETKAVADEFQIIEYCGTYGDCVAIMMRDDHSGYSGALGRDVIADITFFYNSSNRMKIWRESK